MRSLLDIRAGEHRSVAGAFLVLLGVMGSHTLLETARDALFLARLPASRLPWVYLAIAAAGLAVARFGRKRSSGPGPLAATLLVSAAVTAGFWLATSKAHPALLYALYIWSGFFASWAIGKLWLVLGSLFTVVQAKRLFGFIGAGSVLGAVVGAGGASLLSRALPARHLLLASAVLLVVTALGPGMLLPAPVTTAAVKPAAEPRRRSLGEDLREITAHPYTGRILLLVLLSTVALTAVDYAFKAAVAQRVAKENLGTFFANVYVVLNAIALVVQLGAVGFLLRTFGVQRTALVMPTMIGLSAAGLVAGGGLPAALLLKGADGTLRHSLHRTSAELLFVPIEDAVRSRIKPVIDLIGQRGGQALASLGILAAVATLGVGERGLGLVIAALVAAWIGVGLTVQRHYLDLFRENLAKGRLDYQGDLPELDLAALEALFAGLNSERDAEVLASLELLAAQKKQRLIPALLLYHPSRRVVLKALAVLSAEGRRDFIPIAQRLLSHPEPEVRTAALRAWAAVADDESFLRELLEDKCLEVRATALISLIAREKMPEDEANRALDLLARDSSAAVRMALARAIGEQPSARFADVLSLLMSSSEAEVQAEVAWAMGRSRDERWLPELLPLLQHRIQGTSAAEACAQIGRPALDVLDRSLGDPSLPLGLRRNLPRAIARFEPSLAAPVLLAHLRNADDGMLRYRILVALRRLRSFEPDLPLDSALLRSVAEDSARSALRSLAWRLTLERGRDGEAQKPTLVRELVSGLLHDKETHALSRLFRVLALLHPAENFERIQRGLAKSDAKTRASSRELIENLLDGPLRDALLALIEDLPDAERLARAPQTYRPTRVEHDELITTLIRRGGELGTLAAHHAAELGLELVPAAEVSQHAGPLQSLLASRGQAMPEALDAS